LILSFDKIEIRDICVDENKAKHEFGLEIANKLQSRIAELRAYTNASEVIFGTPLEVEDTDYTFPVYKVDLLIDGYNLYFCSNHIKPPLNDNNTLNWKEVSRIKILEINNN